VTDESGDEGDDDMIRDKRKVTVSVYAGEVSSIDKVMHAETRRDCK